jgi:hypothetical protein
MSKIYLTYEYFPSFNVFLHQHYFFWAEKFCKFARIVVNARRHFEFSVYTLILHVKICKRAHLNTYSLAGFDKF